MQEDKHSIQMPEAMAAKFILFSVNEDREYQLSK